MSFLDWLFGNGRSEKEPDYIETSPYDGRKSVDFDKFFKDKRVQDQIAELREKIIKPRIRQPRNP